MMNLYAHDGKCHNAQRGHYNHECGKPAEWIGTTSSGFRFGFCSVCKEHGDERHDVVKWEPAPKRQFSSREEALEAALRGLLESNSGDALAAGRIALASKADQFPVDRVREAAPDMLAALEAIKSLGLHSLATLPKPVIQRSLKEISGWVECALSKARATGKAATGAPG